MGKNNQARRAAKGRKKAKARQRGHESSEGSRSGPWSPEFGDSLFTPDEAARNLLILTAQSQYRGDEFQTGGMDRLVALPATRVDRQAEGVILDQIDALWSGGWQPAELNRQGRLGCAGAAGARLVGAAIAHDHAVRRASTLDPRWIAQIDALALSPTDGRPGWITRWLADSGPSRRDAVTTIVDALANLMHLPTLDHILPPPREMSADPSVAATIFGAESDPLLERIRALLAKAESSAFEAEAIAFTAKAQEMMTRHAIDAATVAATRTGTMSAEKPIATRIPVDSPYVDAKSLLLQVVATAGRCRAVFHSRLSLSTVVGFPTDVAAVELLFTSLLLQAEHALTSAGKAAPPGTRTRSQGYRSAFLLAFTQRIGDRLDEINAAVFSEVEADRGSAFLPVLRSKSAAIDDYVAERFGDLTSSPVRTGFDRAGWASGRIAADNAQLNFADLDEPAGADHAGHPSTGTVAELPQITS